MGRAIGEDYRRLLLFSLPAVPMAVLIVPLITYLPTFYATEVGLSLSAVGLVFMVGRACDGFLDLLVGWLSDASRSPWGRRKPWLVVGLVPLMAATWFLCAPPAGASVLYLLICLVVFYGAWTTVQIPYLSWGAELSASYDERSRVFGFREGGTLVGIILGTGLPALALPRTSTIREVLLVIAVAAIVLLPLTILAAVVLVPQRAAGQSTEHTSGIAAIWANFRRNRAYARFIATWILTYTAVNVYSATVVLIIEERLQLRGSFMALVFCQYLASIFFMPLTIALSRRFGRHRVLAAALIIDAGILILLAVLPSGHFAAAATVFGLLGFPSSAAWALPPAITADLADYGRLKERSDSTGTYMAGYNLALKIGMALGVGIAFPLLDLLGFGSQRATNGHETLPLIVVGCALPAMTLAICAAIIWHHPIDARRCGIINRRLRRREIASWGPVA